MVEREIGKGEITMSDLNGMWKLAIGLMVSLVVAAVVAGFVLQDSGMLSLTPPATARNLDPQPDVAVGEALSLYLSAFTAWASLILLVPVFGFVWLKGHSLQSYITWISFYTVAYVAYLIHLAVSMVMFYGGDFEAMQNSSRVSAFWPGMALIVLWGADVLLGLRQASGAVVAVFRALVHLMIFVLFFGGSTVMGELNTVRMIGFLLLAAAVTGMTVWLRIRTRGTAE